MARNKGDSRESAPHKPQDANNTRVLGKVPLYPIGPQKWENKDLSFACEILHLILGGRE
jgi:hypothetical protein